MATFKSVTLRMTESEAKMIEAGAEALGVSKSTLIATAAQIAAHQLGFYEDGRTLTPQPGSWMDAPVREKGSLEAQMVISLNPLEYQTVRRAAQWSFVSFPVFLVGATFRFLATRKASEPDNPKLAGLELPPEYEPGKKRTRPRS